MNVFNRVEYKYLIDKNIYNNLIELINTHDFKIDQYKRSTIQSLYFDTDNYYLIRHSLEKPIFKEKIRLRNYGDKLNTPLFLEIKRKYKGVVYKRRIETSLNNVKYFINNKYDYHGQIGNEINSFRNHYKNLSPKMLIISEREAYYNPDIDLRFTFDFNIRYRKDNFNFDDTNYDGILLNDNEVLLEIKSIGSYPLWLVSFLNENKIFKTNFSKYGNAYIKTLRCENGRDV